jgi:hypothetical protein
VKKTKKEMASPGRAGKSPQAQSDLKSMFEPPSPESVAAIQKLAERQLSPEEFLARIAAPMSPEEEAGNLELIAWFQRRYPTPAERLAYARRAYAPCQRWMPKSPCDRSAPGSGSRAPTS